MNTGDQVQLKYEIEKALPTIHNFDFREKVVDAVFNFVVDQRIENLELRRMIKKISDEVKQKPAVVNTPEYDDLVAQNYNLKKQLSNLNKALRELSNQNAKRSF